MIIHEYQGKQLFRNAGVSVPEGYPAFSVNDALDAFHKLGQAKVMVKAQIHAGGRGKGGGVQVAHGRKEVRKYAKTILGMNLVTNQTGSKYFKQNSNSK